MQRQSVIIGIVYNIAECSHAPEDQLLFEDDQTLSRVRMLPVENPPTGAQPVGIRTHLLEERGRLGWTSLVVPEEAGGGSVSGQGVKDLSLVAYQFGLSRRRALYSAAILWLPRSVVGEARSRRPDRWTS